MANRRKNQAMLLLLLLLLPRSTVFQQLEVDYCIQRPRHDIWPTKAQQVPVVRIYGVNDAGRQHTITHSSSIQLQRCRYAAKDGPDIHAAMQQTTTQALAAASLAVSTCEGAGMLQHTQPTAYAAAIPVVVSYSREVSSKAQILHEAACSRPSPPAGCAAATPAMVSSSEQRSKARRFSSAGRVQVPSVPQQTTSPECATQQGLRCTCMSQDYGAVCCFCLCSLQAEWCYTTIAFEQYTSNGASQCSWCTKAFTATDSI